MSLLDLLFLLAALTSAVVLLLALGALLRGRAAVAGKLLRRWAIGAACYLAVGLGVSGLRPQRVLAPTEPMCLDDWCLAVDRVSRTASGADAVYRVDLRIFSRAARVSQRAKGAWIYLIDDRGRRYEPQLDASAVPLDALLGPLESLSTSRTFRAPADAAGFGLITGHGGPYCGVMSFLVIGDAGCLFHKPPMIRLPQG